METYATRLHALRAERTHLNTLSDTQFYNWLHGFTEAETWRDTAALALGTLSEIRVLVAEWRASHYATPAGLEILAARMATADTAERDAWVAYRNAESTYDTACDNARYFARQAVFCPDWRAAATDTAQSRRDAQATVNRLHRTWRQTTATLDGVRALYNAAVEQHQEARAAAWIESHREYIAA